MLEIVKKLMHFGMSFEYEHRGANGQVVRCGELGVEVEETINGKVNYEDSERSFVNLLDINNETYLRLARYVEEACARKNASFL